MPADPTQFAPRRHYEMDSGWDAGLMFVFGFLSGLCATALLFVAMGWFL